MGSHNLTKCQGNLGCLSPSCGLQGMALTMTVHLPQHLSANKHEQRGRNLVVII